jgi:hypothetical protein
MPAGRGAADEPPELPGPSRGLGAGARGFVPAGGRRPRGEPDVYSICHLLAGQCDEHERSLGPIARRYGEEPEHELDRFAEESLSSTRDGALGLIRDLQDLYLMASFVDITWTMVKQAGLALRDEELLEVVTRCESQTSVQLAWLSTRMKQAAPQALIVAS